MGRPRNEGKKRRVSCSMLKKKGAFERFLSSQVDTKGKKILMQEIGKMTNVPSDTEQS